MFDRLKTFFGNLLVYLYLGVLTVVGFVFLGASVWGAFMGTFGAPIWMLVGGVIIFLIGQWWEGQPDLWGKARNFAFIYTCTATLGGFVWFAGTGGDASDGQYLRFTSFENIWLGLKHYPLAWITFPLMLWGSIEVLIRLYTRFVSNHDGRSLKEVLIDLYFSDD